MNIKRWINRREESWKRLDTLLNQIDKQGLKTLSATQIKELASLYRSVSADLARAQTNQISQLILKNLQTLTSRSYTHVYQGSRKQEWGKIVAFYRWDFPETVQKTSPYITAATALFIITAIIAWWYTWSDPTFMSLVIPDRLITMVRDEGKLWMGSIVGVEPLASSNIMINNIQVSFAAVAGGVTAGFYTAFIIAYNGLHIGAIATMVSKYGLAYPFWAFVFPHGSLELPAIFFAGGAGFLIARAILFPGKYTRTHALRHYGTEAIKLVFGIVPMLILAGIIEGFFSPSPIIPDPLKYITGTLLLISLILYCTQKRPTT